jgi:cell division protein FtsL
MEAFDYAIKKDVRNNPIVREVDKTRQRELWKTGVVAMLLVIMVLCSAWQHFQLLSHGYQVEDLRREKAQLEELGRKYRLEIETLRSPKRIETLATNTLHLVAPSGDDAVVIERVMAGAPPEASVVARR